MVTLTVNHLEGFSLALDTSIVVWVLCGLYCILAIVPLVQLIRIHQYTPELGWTIQKIFLLFCVGASLVRAVFFGVFVFLQPRNLFLAEDDDPAYVILSNFPRMCFFSTFCLLVLFWAEIIHRVKYHHARSFQRKRYIFIVLNLVVYIIQGLFWYLLFFPPEFLASLPMPQIENLFFAGLSLVVAVLFLSYGGRLFFMLKNFPIESTELHNKLFEVGSITTICTICFLIRGVLLLLTSLMHSVDNSSYMMFSYCLTVEVVPCGLVLMILSRFPVVRNNNSVDSQFLSSTDASIYGSMTATNEPLAPGR